MEDAGLARGARAGSETGRSDWMTRYLISFDAHAMDHIPDDEMAEVSRAAHAVVRDAVNAGVWVFGAGLERRQASIVTADGTVSDGPHPQAVGGFCIVDVPSLEDALEWAARVAVACRCAQEVRALMADPEQDAMLSSR